MRRSSAPLFLMALVLACDERSHARLAAPDASSVPTPASAASATNADPVEFEDDDVASSAVVTRGDEPGPSATGSRPAPVASGVERTEELARDGELGRSDEARRVRGAVDRDAPGRADLATEAPIPSVDAPPSSTPGDVSGRVDLAAGDALAAGGAVADDPVADAPAEDRVGGELAAGEDADASDAADSGLVVDVERGELRVPARFVRATRQIEVFACHVSGPTHETVLEFEATGAELIRAFAALGCRSTDSWNTGSPGDFLRNQGDRLLLLVRWEHAGKSHEVPAEALLLEGDTRFRSFVRGFSFSVPGALIDSARSGAAPPPAAEGAAGEVRDGAGPIPRAVEFTLGATTRERAVFSLLLHPTTLRGDREGGGGEPCRSLQPWTFPPFVDESLSPRASDESGVDAELVFRVVKSELELLDRRRAFAKELNLDRQALFDRLEPHARRIDVLKSGYREIADAVTALLDAPLDRIHPDGHAEFAARAESMHRLGRWYASRTQAEYFAMYLAEDRFKLAALEADPDLDPSLRQYARDVVEGGLRFEPALAREEVELRRGALEDLVVRQRMLLLELERGRLIELSRTRHIDETLATLGPEDAYRRRLFEEDRRQSQLGLEIIDARRAMVEALVDEIGARLGDTWSGARATEVDRKRQLAGATLICARGESELLLLDEEIRWAENDLESGVAEREANARTKLEEFQARRLQVAEGQREALRERDRLRAAREE